MALDSVFSQLQKFGVIPSVSGITRSLLYRSDPYNYELYEMKIQVIDGSDDTEVVEEFSFRIMPESVMVPHQYRTSVIPTLGGSYTLDSEYESPSTFQVTGTFGLNHKALINLRTLKGKGEPVLLTGYGLAKRLEKIIAISKQSNWDGIPNKTYLINKAFNSVQRVEIQSATFRQDISRNTLWVYDIQFIKIKDENPTYFEEGFWEFLLNQVLKYTSSALTSVPRNLMKSVTGGL